MLGLLLSCCTQPLFLARAGSAGSVPTTCRILLAWARPAAGPLAQPVQRLRGQYRHRCRLRLLLCPAGSASGQGCAYRLLMNAGPSLLQTTLLALVPRQHRLALLPAWLVWLELGKHILGGRQGVQVARGHAPCQKQGREAVSHCRLAA